MQSQLIEALRALAPEKKPSVNVLAGAAGLDKVAAKERDAAWKIYQSEMLAEAGAESGGYRITVKRDGFRRAGRAWFGTTEVTAAELADEDLDLLRADPMFRVERV